MDLIAPPVDRDTPRPQGERRGLILVHTGTGKGKSTAALARRIVPENVAYVDLSYGQAFKLSAAYQGGIVAWVAFWAIYGRGMGIENMSQIATFGAAYMTVVLVEPLVDLGVLAAAKALRRLQGNPLVNQRVYSAA